MRLRAPASIRNYHSARHPLQFGHDSCAFVRIAQDQHHPRACFGVRRRHEDRRMEEDFAARGSARGALGRRGRRGRRMVDDPHRRGNDAGQWFENGIDGSIVGQREMNPVDPIDGRGRIREGAGPGRFERLRFRNVAVPDVDLMTVLQRAAHEAGTHQTRAENAIFRISPCGDTRRSFRVAGPVQTIWVILSESPPGYSDRRWSRPKCPR